MLTELLEESVIEDSDYAPVLDEIQIQNECDVGVQANPAMFDFSTQTENYTKEAETSTLTFRLKTTRERGIQVKNNKRNCKNLSIQFPTPKKNRKNW